MAEKKTRRARYAQQTQEAIFAAAETIFAQKGFDGARVEDIAVAAQCSKGSLFQYFPDKWGIYQAVVRRLKEQISADMEQALCSFWGDTEQKLSAERVRLFLEQVIGWYFTYLIEHPHLRRLLAWETAGEWHTLQQIPVLPDDRRQFALLLQVLHQAQEASLVRSDLSAEMIVATIQGLCLIYPLSLPHALVVFGDPGPTSPEMLAQIGEKLISLLLEGMLPGTQS